MSAGGESPLPRPPRPRSPPLPVFPFPRRFPLSLLAALLLYLALAATTTRQVGTVGEVDLSWGLGAPPQALWSLDPPTWADGTATPTAGARRGPLVLNQVRPVAHLALGPLDLPLAVNAYTGGLPDWPARLVWLLTGSRRAVVALHVLLGGVLLAGLHHLLRRRGTDVAAAVGGLVLATDWAFLFYRKVLGGTELALLAGGLLCLWGLWSRRWGGGRHGLSIFAAGVGLGLLGKVTFALSLAALLGAALLTRWDKPAMQPPPPRALWKPTLVLLLLLSPLLVAGLGHALWVPSHLPSHDFPTLQLDRVLRALSGGDGPAREGAANLWWFLSEPLAFLGPAYGVTDLPGPNPLRLLGWTIVGLGVVLAWADAWRDRSARTSPQDALLRFTSLTLLLQVGLLWTVARDLHHLAQATPTLAIVAGLSLDRLAGRFTPPRSPARARTALLLALPLMLGGATSLVRTDEAVRQVAVPTFTEAGQAAMVALLDQHGVERLLVADYESYGMLELRLAEADLRVDVVHAWPALARAMQPPEPTDLVPALLHHAATTDRHLLTVRASQPMAYNLRARPSGLERAAEQAGVDLVEVGRLPDGAAVLYRVE